MIIETIENNLDYLDYRIHAKINKHQSLQKYSAVGAYFCRLDLRVKFADFAHSYFDLY